MKLYNKQVTLSGKVASQTTTTVLKIVVPSLEKALSMILAVKERPCGSYAKEN